MSRRGFYTIFSLDNQFPRKKRMGLDKKKVGTADGPSGTYDKKT
jgi:hypothetical protein